MRWTAILSLILVAVAGGCAREHASPRPRPSGTPQARIEGPAKTRAVRVGTSGDYPPLSVWAGDRPTGFGPELVEAFAGTQRSPLAWERFRWPELLTDFRAGRFDVVADGITVRPERSVAGVFTVPIARGGAVLLLRRPRWAGAPSPGVDVRREVGALDRPELRVVVNRGGHLERVTRSLLPSADVRAIPDNPGVRDAFARGEADAAMTNTFEAPRWAEGLAGVERLGPLTTDVTALWVRADRLELAEQLDTWLLQEEETGRLSELRARSLGQAAGEPTARPVSSLLAATAERLALMPFVAAAKEAAGLPVEDVAQEGRVLDAAFESVRRAAEKLRRPVPQRELVDALFRAQIEAAKVVQKPGTARPKDAAFTLDRDLRPAIARITSRMAFLLVRIPKGTHRESIAREARAILAESGVDPDTVGRLSDAIEAFAR